MVRPATIPSSIVLALLMALAVNEALPGRAILRMAFFLPTMLPMIAVANIWLFFYTPDYGLFDRVLAVFGGGRHNWLGDASTALPAMIAVAVWKEAGFFMIFYLAALQTMPTDLREAAALEGSSRWNYFRRVTVPLLMPTTLFVLVNAVINAFRVIDHIVVMTRGGPDNATTLLLYYIYETGFRFWDTATRSDGDSGAAGDHGAGGGVPVRRAGPAGTLPMMVADRSDRAAASRRGRVAARPHLDAAAALRGVDRVPSSDLRDAFQSAGAADIRQSRGGLAGGAVRALPAQHRDAGHADPGSAVRTVHAGGFRFRATGVSRPRCAVRGGAATAHGDAGVLLVENYRTLVQLHLADTILAIALPYLGRRSGYSCCGRRF